MRYLVTGGSGFIGSTFIKKALTFHENLKVLNIDCLTYATHPESTKEIESHRNYNFKKINILNFDALKKEVMEFEPTRIIHFAAESHVDNSISEPETFIRTNIIGSYNLLRVASEYFSNLPSTLKKQFCFHHISTDEVFGDLPEKQNPSTENDVYLPSSPYSASKASADHLVKSWYRTYKLPYTITYCTNNYGPYQNKEKLIPLVISKILGKQNIPIYGDGLQSRSWIFVEDHIDILLKLFVKNLFNTEFNISSGDEVSNLELVKKICYILDNIYPNKSGEPYANLITFVKDRTGHDRRYALDNTKIKIHFKDKIFQSLDEGLYKTINWTLKEEGYVS